jgi:neutral ceramidase
MVMKFFGFLCACVATLGCASPIWGVIEKRADLGGENCEFRVGAAKVDLTPTPGIPMGGFSIASKASRGVWDRMNARAIYIEDTACEALVLVSTDLVLMPNGLVDRVADLLEDSAPHVGRENLLLASTENHSAPAHFYSSKLLNHWGSPVDGGFDREIFDYFANRIASAVEQAVANKEKARLRVNYADGTSSYEQGETDPTLNKKGESAPYDSVLKGVFRNRSLRAFLRNPEAAEYLVPPAQHPYGLADCAPFPTRLKHHPFFDPESIESFPPSACKAVYPRVDILEFEGYESGERIAVAAFLAVHTTVLPASFELYSADLFGLTSARLERGELPELKGASRCAADGPFPVVALFNGAQGDVTATWTTRDRADALDLSGRIAEKICSLVPGDLEEDPRVAFRFDEIPVEKTAFHDPHDGMRVHTTAPEPQAGASEMGGGPDGRTIFYDLGYKTGERSYRRTEHGSKRPPFTVDIKKANISIGRSGTRCNPPAKKAPVGVYRIGRTVIASVPGEPSTIMGDRIRRLVAEKIDDERQVLLAGLAGGYVSYFPTPEEYDAQFYEGGAEYFGPGSGALVAAKLGELADKLKGEEEERKRRAYSYSAGPPIAFRLRDVGWPPYHVDDGLRHVAQDLETRFPKRDFPTYCWVDALPRLKHHLDQLVREEDGDPDNDRPDDQNICRRNVPEVSIHRKGSPNAVVRGGRSQDSEGTDLVTLAVTVSSDRAEWCAIWLVPDPLEGEPKDDHFEFRVRRITDRETDPPDRSSPFTLAGGFEEKSSRGKCCENARLLGSGPGDRGCDPGQMAQEPPQEGLDGATDKAPAPPRFIERGTCGDLRAAVRSNPCSGWLDLIGLCDIGVDYCAAPEKR